jgi:tetratricopeptide (TPR) repeat protein
METYEKSNNFIGREQEVQLFESWLQDPTPPWILYFHDAAEEKEKKGGIGKTQLLRHCAELTKQKYPNTAVLMIDFFSVADRDRLVLAQRVTQELHNLCPEWTPTAFNDLADQYYDNKNIETTMSRRAADIAEDETIFTAISAALVEDIQRLEPLLEQQQKKLLLLFDTFEAIEDNPIIAVSRQSQTFPDTYGSSHLKIVMAGRNPLNWQHLNWSGRKHEVQVISLGPFNKQEMLTYIDAEALYNSPPQEEAQIRALYTRTEGRPIMIGLVVDVLNHRLQSLAQLIAVPEQSFEQYLIPQINKLENPINWVVLFMAHAYHYFNMALLEQILDRVPQIEPIRSVNRDEMSLTLPHLSFVRRASTGDSFVLHDEMRRLVVKYCWEGLDTDKRLRKDISLCVIDYFSQQLENRQSESWSQLCELAILHHRLFINLEDGLTYFKKRFLNARRLRRRAFARLLFLEVQNFSSSLSFAQQNDLKLAEAHLLRLEGATDEALKALAYLETHHDKQWFKHNYYEILSEKGFGYQRKNRWQDAIQCFEDCLTAETARNNMMRVATLLHQLGYIARRRGQFTTALNYYRQSADTYKQLNNIRDYTYVLNNMSHAYCLQGKIEEALLYCKMGWNLRRNMFLKGEIDEMVVGWSLNTLGFIHFSNNNLSEAESYYNNAHDIFVRANSQSDIAIVYTRLGLVQFERRNFNEALKWFRQAQQTAVEANVEHYITSLNWQGRIAKEQGHLTEAQALYEQVLQRSQQVADEYQHVEGLIYLANCLDAQNQTDRAQQMLEEARELASERNFYQLLGRIDRRRGETLYHQGNFKEAFQCFVAYCHDMTLYNYADYRIAVQRMIDALVGILDQDVKSIANDILHYWEDHNLNEGYPELITACKGVVQLL